MTLAQAIGEINCSRKLHTITFLSNSSIQFQNISRHAQSCWTGVFQLYLGIGVLFLSFLGVSKTPQLTDPGFTMLTLNSIPSAVVSPVLYPTSPGHGTLDGQNGCSSTTGSRAKEPHMCMACTIHMVSRSCPGDSALIHHLLEHELPSC